MRGVTICLDLVSVRNLWNIDFFFFPSMQKKAGKPPLPLEDGGELKRLSAGAVPPQKKGKRSRGNCGLFVCLGRPGAFCFFLLFLVSRFAL